MDNPLLNPEDAMQRLEDWKARAEKLAEDTQAASEGLQSLRVTAADDNGIVETTINSSGALIDIRLSSRVQRQAPEYTQAAILNAYNNTQKKLAEAAAEVVRETVGSESATGKALMNGFKLDDEEGR